MIFFLFLQVFVCEGMWIRKPITYEGLCTLKNGKVAMEFIFTDGIV